MWQPLVFYFAAGFRLSVGASGHCYCVSGQTNADDVWPCQSYVFETKKTSGFPETII